MSGASLLQRAGVDVMGTAPLAACFQLWDDRGVLTQGVTVSVHLSFGWRLIRVWLACAMLAGCASSPRHGGGGELRLDTETAARVRHVAAVGQAGRTAGAGVARVVASQLAEWVPTLLEVMADARAVEQLEEQLEECARQAEQEVNARYFGDRAPTREECGEEVQVDGCPGPVTRAMLLGQQKHEVALQCAQRVLEQLWPGPFSLEQRYRYYPNAKFVETVSREEEARLLAQGCTKELWRTIKPDIVLHQGRNLRQGLLIFDYKFPCPPTNEPRWTRCGESSRMVAPTKARSIRMRWVVRRSSSPLGQGCDDESGHSRHPLARQIGVLRARDGVVVCFFMHRSHSEVAAAVWRALQIYLQAIPPHSLKWYGSDDGDTLPLDGAGWEVIRKQMLERPWGGEWLVELAEQASEAGGYHFEYNGRKLDAELFAQDEHATTGVLFTFPTEYLLEHGPVRLRALALELASELPFSFGYASLAFVCQSGMWYGVKQELREVLPRYLGFDLYHLGDTSRAIGTRARGAYWLTFLGQPLLGQLGGVEGLRQKLPFEEVTVQPLEAERALITLGEWPEAIDTAKRREEQKLLPQYRTLAHLLEPYLYEERTGFFSLDPEDMRRWLRRLCQ